MVELDDVALSDILSRCQFMLKSDFGIRAGCLRRAANHHGIVSYVNQMTLKIVQVSV
jgi:hypothetical protein